MEKPLSQLKPLEKGTVKSISFKGAIRRRLIDMGITPDAVIMMKKVAPFGDPIEIRIRGYELSLRRSEADQVIVEL